MNQNRVMRTQKYQVLNASMLKWIAIVTMLIDHIGAVILFRVLRFAPLSGASREVMTEVYEICRTIGRISFPIYCFFIVEGYMRTRKVSRYFLRLGILAIVSEFFFDLAFFTTVSRGFDWNALKHHHGDGQNVILTFLLGLLAIFLIDKIRKSTYRNENSGLPGKVLCIGAYFLITAAMMYTAYLLKTDYDYKGVLAIVLMYFFYPQLGMMGIAGYAALFRTDAFCLPGLLFVQLYNGEKGKINQWFAYSFYPIHLAVLYLISIVICKLML